MQSQIATAKAQEWYRQHDAIQVSDPLLDDLVFLYASEALPEDEVEPFVERMAETAYKAAIRLDFCHSCMAVNAAMFLPEDEEEVYQAFVALLQLCEEDEVLAKMKRFILRKLADDALDAVEDTDRFGRRVDFAEKTV